MCRPSHRHFAPENLDPRLRAGLVGHWIGGGSGLTWQDRSGYGNHGALTNGPLWTLGKGGHRAALSFDGTDDGVNVGSSAALTPTAGLTISVLARINPTNAQYGALVSRWNVSGNPYFLATVAGTPSSIEFYTDTPSPDFTITGAPTSEWALITATNDGTTSRGYVNGVLKASGAGTLVTGGGVTSIGRDINRAAFQFFGLIDEVRIYNRALSAAEIALLAQPSFLPVVPRRWFIPSPTITTDAMAAYASWVAPAATARLRLTTQATAASSTWTAPSATAQTRYTVSASAASSSWVAPSAAAQMARRRAISVLCSVSGYSIGLSAPALADIPCSSSSYQIEVS